MPNPIRIFISYSSKDRERVNLLADELGEMFADATIWYDTSLDREGGHYWWDTICEQIRACGVFIRVVSMTENASVPCQRERSYATAINRPILPVRIDAVDIRDLEARYQATQIVDFREGSLAQRKALKASIQGLPPAPPLPDNAVELQPDAPLDPIGILRDRIRTLGSDAREQRQLINDIHELEYQDKYKAEIPDLVARLRVHREILMGASLELMAKLFGTNETSQPPTPIPSQLTPRPDSEPKLDSAAYNNRGAARDDKHNLDGAISDYTEAIRLDPNDAMAYCKRGVARSAKGDHDGAISDYNGAIRLDPKFAAAYFFRGNARKVNGDNDGAISDYTEAIRLDSDLALAFNNRGNARSAKGDFDGAISDYNEAIRLNPQYADAYNNRRVARSAKGDKDGAISDYNESIRLDPKNAAACYNRGLILEGRNQHREAASDFQRAIELSTVNDPNYLNSYVLKREYIKKHLG